MDAGKGILKREIKDDIKRRDAISALCTASIMDPAFDPEFVRRILARFDVAISYEDAQSVWAFIMSL